MTGLTGLLSPGAPRVYIVDDEEDMAKAIGLLFKILRYKSDLFANARDLARYMLASAALPNLLLVDMVMPEVNGMDVIKWIRGSKRFKSIPIIVLSNETHPELLNDALAAGANAYLFKPATLEDLENALIRATGQSPRKTGMLIPPRPARLTSHGNPT
ncbi:MAG TPA: response regulator [Anaerolineales bacterium]|nr:response regulator [Anaerolineales bacterium]